MDAHLNPAEDDAATASLQDAHIAIVGDGRLGNALAAALRECGMQVSGPHGRGYDGLAAESISRPDVVLLCVPDRAIVAASAALTPRPGMLVGHCSGATTLADIQGHEAFSMHPLMTIPRVGARFDGAVAAVAGATGRALATAQAIAARLGMTAVQVADDDRVAYHAAAAVSSNQLLAVLELAEQLGASAGVRREHLAPLIRAAVDNWVATGAASALTGPVVRGDEETIAGHRAVVRQRCAADAELYDELLAATRRLAASTRSETVTHDDSKRGATDHHTGRGDPDRP